jgi:hypothetical protein
MSKTQPKTQTRPPMLLFLVFKITMVLLPVVIFSSYMSTIMGIENWISAILSAVVGWWLLSKYDEILIDVVDYTRAKDDSRST